MNPALCYEVVTGEAEVAFAQHSSQPALKRAELIINPLYITFNIFMKYGFLK